jgi:hypothetical protein
MNFLEATLSPRRSRFLSSWLAGLGQTCHDARGHRARADAGGRWDGLARLLQGHHRARQSWRFNPATFGYQVGAQLPVTGHRSPVTGHRFRPFVAEKERLRRIFESLLLIRGTPVTKVGVEGERGRIVDRVLRQ